MLATYEEAEGDPELLELKSAIALAESRIVDLINRADTGESGHAWDQLAKLKTQLLQTQDPGAQHAILEQLLDSIDQAQSEYHTWHEIFELIDKRRKLTDSEAKRLEKMSQFFTAEQGMMLTTRLVAIIRNHITDQKILDAIAADIRQLEYFNE